jgi:hypothetical protein
MVDEFPLKGKALKLKGAENGATVLLLLSLGRHFYCSQNVEITRLSCRKKVFSPLGDSVQLKSDITHFTHNIELV